MGATCKPKNCKLESMLAKDRNAKEKEHKEANKAKSKEKA